MNFFSKLLKEELQKDVVYWHEEGTFHDPIWHCTVHPYGTEYLNIRGYGSNVEWNTAIQYAKRDYIARFGLPKKEFYEPKTHIQLLIEKESKE